MQRPGCKFCFLLFLTTGLVLTQDNSFFEEEHADIVDKSGKVLEIAEKAVGEIAEVLKGKEVAGLFGKMARVLGNLGPIFMAFNAVISIVTMFMPAKESAEMKEIKKGFDRLNSRLSGMQATIVEIRAIAEVASAKTSLALAFDSIINLERELIIARRRQTHIAWDYYVKQFQQEYNNAADSVYWALIGDAAAQDTELRFDVLKLYQEKFKCGITPLTRLCLVGLQTINRGLALEGAYLAAIKYTSKIKESRLLWHKRIDGIINRCGQVRSHFT
ncbi:hypothetical protein Ciccas_004129 [Cichlidogyrus casuarinus]|uniref:Uncharacterized protein n=1 Tax=Cichlidogyrus casuarinus TaxID=1844966 RepID=A0ABD2QCC2_9PLAT